MSRNQIIFHWLPAVFCAALSVIALIQFTAVSSNSWPLVFVVFVPMSFFLVGLVTYSMSREVRALQAEIAALRGQRSTAHDAT
ncbi:MAG: hypothetical protein ACREPT_03335 [Rudaea sp.]